MTITAFNRRMGTTQGRLSSTVAPDGSYVFVLGSAEESIKELLNVGDFVQVEQSLDLTGLRFIRAQLLFSVPESLPSGYRWRAAIVVDGVSLATVDGVTGKERRIKDLVAVVEEMTGTHTVAVRLTLLQEYAANTQFAGYQHGNLLAAFDHTSEVDFDSSGGAQMVSPVAGISSFVLTQSTSTKRPKREVRGDGIGELVFDGSNDFLQSPDLAAAIPLDNWSALAHGCFTNPVQWSAYLWAGNSTAGTSQFDCGANANGTSLYTYMKSVAPYVYESGISNEVHAARLARRSVLIEKKGSVLTVISSGGTYTATGLPVTWSNKSTNLTVGCANTGAFSPIRLTSLWVFGSSFVDKSAALAAFKQLYPDYQ